MYPKRYPDNSEAGITGSSPYHYLFYTKPAASILYLLALQILNFLVLPARFFKHPNRNINPAGAAYLFNSFHHSNSL